MLLGSGIGALYLYIHAIPAWVLVRILRLIFKKIMGKNLELSREYIIKEGIFNLFIIYLIVLVGVVFLPVVFLTNGKFMNNPVDITVIPFEGFTDAIRHGDIRRVVINIVGNLLLLTPLIIFLKLLWKKTIRNYSQAYLLALAVSFFIEFVQFLEDKFTPPFNRAVDISDIILNSLGGLIGFAVYKFIFQRLRYCKALEEVPGE